MFGPLSLALALALALMSSQGEPIGGEPVEQTPPGIYYDGGLRTRNTDGDVQFRFNGRVMYDAASFDDGFRDEDVVDTAEFRRVRLLVQGTIGEHLGARAQWLFSDSREDLLEYRIDWRTAPWGRLSAGYFREPFGLNAKTSSAYLTFMERSAPTDAFTPGRNRGLELSDRGERWSWAVGAFREAAEALPDDGLGDGRSFSGRVTYLPWRGSDDAELLHLGLSWTHREPGDDDFSLAARPPVHLLERLIDTGSLDVDSADLLGIETAWVDGPRSVQGELFLGELDLEDSGRAPVGGVSVEGSWFLTGEHKAYRDSSSSFGKLDVQSPVLGAGGHGAWELALRWSLTDLDGDEVRGGEMQDWTLGLNWYLSDSTRVMLNWVVVDVEDSRDDGDVLMARFQLGF